jgi:hypothetical protein
MIRSRGRARGRERADATDKWGWGVNKLGWAGQPSLEAGARVRGREEIGRIWIEGLRLDPL